MLWPVLEKEDIKLTNRRKAVSLGVYDKRKTFPSSFLLARRAITAVSKLVHTLLRNSSPKTENGGTLIVSLKFQHRGTGGWE